MQDYKLVKQIKNFIRNGKIKLNQKILTFLFFLLLSVIFWLLNALDQDYTTVITYPVHYSNFPKNKVLIGDVPNRLSLNVSAHGYTLLRFKLNSRKIPIIFDVRSSSLYKVPGESSTTYYVLTRLARDRIATQLGSNIQVHDILPDTLYFQFAEVVTKMVAVEPSVKISLSKQFMIKGGITAEPDSIKISGPNIVIDTINKVFTKLTEVNDVNSTVKRTVSLEDINKVSFARKRVTIVIPVEKFTEGNMKIPVHVINQPDSIDLKLFPSTVKVSYIVPLSDFTKVKPSQFNFTIDYNDIRASSENKPRINLEKYPDFISSVQFSPKTLDYIIEK